MADAQVHFVRAQIRATEAVGGRETRARRLLLVAAQNVAVERYASVFAFLWSIFDFEREYAFGGGCIFKVFCLCACVLVCLCTCVHVGFVLIELNQTKITHLTVIPDLTIADSAPITTRQLESTIRLTEARARAELREEATEQVCMYACLKVTERSCKYKHAKRHASMNTPW